VRLPAGMDRGIRAAGIAHTFDQGRADFEKAWRRVLPKCTEQDFAQHRYERAHTAWKYAMRVANADASSERLGEVLLRRPDQH
jgi:hypothetical protein